MSDSTERIPPDEGRLDRLTDAIEAFLDREGADGSVSDEEFLSRHADLRDLLEPMLEEESGHRFEETGDGWRYLGDYRIVREIGRGGMGVVYEAQHVPLSRRVALKVLPPHLTLSAKQIERFRREAAAIAKLQHPGIVPVYDVGSHKGVHYFAMELLEGHSLGERLASGGPLGILANKNRTTESAELVARIAEALQAAHERGVLHRDVKPHNIFVLNDGSIRLLDFGLALDQESDVVSRTGDFAGTPHYASPEQIAGKRDAIDPRTDIFSLGVVLYELISGARPFTGESTQHILDAIRTRDPINLRQQSRPGVPRDLAIICHKALEKDPAHRYATAGEFAADLRRFLEHEPILAEPPGPLTRASKWVRRNVVATTVATVFLAALVPTGMLIRSLWRMERQLERRDEQHLTETRRLLDTQLALLERSGLRDRPNSEDLYLAELERLERLYRTFLKEGAQDIEPILRALEPRIQLAIAYDRLGRKQDALDIHSDTIRVLKELEKLHPEDRRVPYGLARAHERRAGLNLVLSKVEPARQDVQRSLELCSTLIANPPGDSTGQTTWLAVLHAASARAHATLGDVLSASGDDPAAIEKEYRAALAAWSEVPEGHEERRQSRYNQARVRTGLGRLFLISNRLEAAESEYRAGLAAFESQTDSPLVRRAIAECHVALGFVERKRGDTAAALTHLERALEIQRRLVRDYPGTTSYLENVANSLRQKAEILRTDKQTVPAARAAVDEALPLIEKLCADAPEVFKFRQLRALLSATDASIHLTEASEGARDALLTARTRMAQIAEERPADNRLKCQTALLSYQLAYLESQRGADVAAFDAAKAAVDQECVAHAAHPAETRHAAALYRYHRFLLNAAMRTGKHQIVPETIERLLPLAEAEVPALVASAQDLVRCMSFAAKDADLSNDARRDAQQRYADLAITRLQRAVELDVSALERFADKPAFRPLKGYDRYQQLLRTR